MLADVHGNPLETVSTSTAEAINFEEVVYDMHMSCERNYGRKEKRYLYVTEEINWLPMKDEWKGIKSIVCLYSHRTENEKAATEKRYYLKASA